MSTPNWANLVRQGRCFAHGVPWSKEQAHAAHELHIPADYVRRGCLDLEAYEALRAKDEAFMKKEGEMPLEALPLDHLMKKAADMGIEFTSDVTADGLRALMVEMPKSAKPKAKKKK